METIRVIGQEVLPAALRVGGHYRIATDASVGIDGILARLPGFPKTVRVDRDGGLLSHLTVWENLVLPLEYHGLNTGHALEDATLLFALGGVNESDLHRLMGSYPDALSDFEKRLTGFIRGLLLEPEVLVLNDVFDGLTLLEKSRASQWEHLFRLRFPFRVLLHYGQEETVSCEMVKPDEG